MSDQHITAQPRCPHCDHEQHLATIVLFSYGDVPCQGCGKTTTRMTRTQYRAALNAMRAQRHTHE